VRQYYNNLLRIVLNTVIVAKRGSFLMPKYCNYWNTHSVVVFFLLFYCFIIILILETCCLKFGVSELLVLPKFGTVDFRTTKGVLCACLLLC